MKYEITLNLKYIINGPKEDETKDLIRKRFKEQVLK